jgi:Fic family protein
MDQVSGLRARPASGPRERRLASLLEARARIGDEAALQAVVEDAQLLGSLELAGCRIDWPDVRASRETGTGPEEVVALRRARETVDPQAPLTVAVIRDWHAALMGPVGFRREQRERDGAAPAPPGLIQSRLALLESWLGARSGQDLGPEQAAALAMARIVEVLPFDDGNGRVARLAASHLMVRGGRRPPILVSADRPRLDEALRSALRLETEALTTLLDEASARALDVMIQALEKGEI